MYTLHTMCYFLLYTNQYKYEYTCKSHWTGWWKVMKLKWHTAGRVQIASPSSLHLQITCIHRGGDGIASSSKEQLSSSVVLAVALWLVVSREVDVIAHQMNRTGQSRVHVSVYNYMLLHKCVQYNYMVSLWLAVSNQMHQWRGSDTREGCKIALILMCSDIRIRLRHIILFCPEHFPILSVLP